MFRFDDRLWREVWERNLDQAERHAIAMNVWRRQHPGNQFDAMVAFELARRWRAHSRFLAVIYLLWTLFWGTMAVRDLQLHPGFESLVSPMCALVGVLAVTACLAVRRYLASWLRVNAVPLR